MSLDSLFDVMHAEVIAVRIAIAQRRDDLPTRAELLAKLAVYEEFGR